MKLSILVPSIEERRGNFLKRILSQLNRQIAPYKGEVEVLTLVDNRELSVGEKRNKMLDMATGEFLVFIDDDDRVAPEYLDEVMSVLSTQDPDCIVYDCICKVVGFNGRVRETIYCKYGVEFEYTKTGDQWRGKPAHVMVWRSSIAKRHRYRPISAGEDVDWVKRACVEIESQVRIDKTLYFYDNDQRLSTSVRGTRWRNAHPEHAQELLGKIAREEESP